MNAKLPISLLFLFATLLSPSSLLLAQDSTPVAMTPAEMRVSLIDAIELEADWCRENRLLKSVNRAFRVLLRIDPRNRSARVFLGYKLEQGAWVASKRPRKRNDSDIELSLDAEARWARLLWGQLSALHAGLKRDDQPEATTAALQELILKLDPDDRVVRKLRREAFRDGAWLMEETVRSMDSRAAFGDLIREAFEQAASEVPGAPKEMEAAHNLEFHVARWGQRSVLSTESLGEALDVSLSLPVIQSLFQSVLQNGAFLPGTLRVFLLHAEPQRELFLQGYPEMDESYAEGLRQVTGTGLRGTSDWVFWRGDRGQRKDGIVRLACSYLLQQTFKVSTRQGWLFEGLGLYLTQAVTGTRLTIFQEFARGTRNASDMKQSADLTSPDANWMKEALAVLHAWTPSEYEDIFAKPVQDLQREDLLASYATAAFLAEAYPDQLYRIALQAPSELSSAGVVQRELGMDLERLLGTLRRWIEESHGEEFIPIVASVELRNAWSSLGGKQRKAAVALFEDTVQALDSSQLGVMRRLLSDAPNEYPLQKALGHYSPEEHAPGDAIARTLHQPGSDAVGAVKSLFFHRREPRAQIRVVDYDWGTGKVLRVREKLSAAEVFENAVNGFAPGFDAARAVALSLLDGGDSRVMQQAFEHSYTDRAGGVYPGVRIYDAWNSGAEFEVPDVDALGIYHDVTDDWESFVSPIPNTQHGRLYSIIDSYFKLIRAERNLHMALVDCLLEGEPVNSSFAGPRTYLHGLWAQHNSKPKKLKSQLPRTSDQESWIADLVASRGADEGFWKAGELRRKQFGEDGNRIRHSMLQAIKEVLGH